MTRETRRAPEGSRELRDGPTAGAACADALLAVALLAAVVSSGCTHIGPQTVAVDRFDYSTAIADSWKQQTLLNIVKLRYMDLPVFVDVASIVSGYSLQTGVTAGGTLSSRGAMQGDLVSIGGQAVYTDRPTITYVPMTGEKFLRGLITPIDPKHIFSMLQSGYAADFILGLTVESLNGVRNRSVYAGTVREADPEFIRTLQLMRSLQSSGAFGMRLEKDDDKGVTGVVFFRRDDVSAETQTATEEIRRLLHLAAEQQRFALTYSPVRGAETELAVNSRSMLQIMTTFASYIEVPGEHLDRRVVAPALEASPPGERHDLVRVHSGADEPTSAFVKVRYRQYWYWIDDSDWQTKRALTAIVFFFTLAETGTGDTLPMITIPAQ